MVKRVRGWGSGPFLPSPTPGCTTLCHHGDGVDEDDDEEDDEEDDPCSHLRSP